MHRNKEKNGENFNALFPHSLSVKIGCGGHVNRSFGQLQIDRNRGSSYLSCSFVIGNIGISQGVAPIWIQDLYLASYYG